MGEDFKEELKEIQKGKYSTEEIKKYIAIIGNALRYEYENCKEDQPKEEIIQEFLEEFEKSFTSEKSAEEILDGIFKYRTYKEIISLYKGNKAKFDSLVREAKKQEAQDSKEKLRLNLDKNGSMVSAIRSLMRMDRISKTKDIYDTIQNELKNISKELKELMISSIQKCIATLEEYGFIDDYIEQSNIALEELGLGKVKVLKRNPIADEQYNSQGDLIKNSEDIGVIDTFSRENLEKLSIEDLLMLTTFWELKYFQEQKEMITAMSAIKTCDLWNVLIKGDKKEIENIDSNKIEASLKKDLALKALRKAIADNNRDNKDKKIFRKKTLITERMKKQYRSFIEKSGIVTNAELDEELETGNLETTESEKMSNEVIILGCGVMMQLIQRDNPNNKKWGTIDISENDAEKEKYVAVVVENKNFRVPLIMIYYKDIIKRFFKFSELNLPEYDIDLDENSLEIMTRMFIPSSEFFKKTMKQISKNKENGKQVNER